MTEEAHKRLELKIPTEVLKKFEDAANELNHIQKIITFDARTLMLQQLEAVDLDDMVNDSLLFVDRHLQDQRDAVRKARADSKAKDRKEEAAA